jgi:hypothetical protein
MNSRISSCILSVIGFNSAIDLWGKIRDSKVADFIKFGPPYSTKPSAEQIHRAEMDLNNSERQREETKISSANVSKQAKQHHE